MKLMKLLEHIADDQLLRLFEDHKWICDIPANVLNQNMFCTLLNYDVDYVSGIVLTSMNGEQISCIQIYLDEPEDE